MRISDDQKLELFHSRERSWNAGNAVAGMVIHSHSAPMVKLLALLHVQHDCVKPAGQRDARGFHQAAPLAAGDAMIVAHFAAPCIVLSGSFCHTVVNPLREEIEPD